MKISRPTYKQGFALISSLMIMMLLIIVALATLSLSSTSTRSAANRSGINEAKANARLALMLAIGRLQEQMGPDQRISANANILSLDATGAAVSVANPHWTGVWDSWKAGVGESSQHSTIGGTDEMAPSYVADRSDYFRGWLLSLDENDLNPDPALNLSLPISLTLDGQLTPSTSETAIQLVGPGSLGEGNDADFVSARLLSVSDPSDPASVSGRYGWWVGDQNQKAKLMRDSYRTGTLTSADKIFRTQAPGSMGNTSTPGLETLSDIAELEKLTSLNTLDLISLGTPTPGGDADVSQRNFHDASIYSRGVLSDVREGGLKRDLSAILERPIDVSEDGEEFSLYEFDDPRFPDRNNSKVPIQDLAAYYQLYQDDSSWANGRRGGIQYGSTQLPNAIQIKTPNYDGGNGDREKFQREYTALYRQPAIAKVQFLLGVGAQEVTAAERAEIKALSDARDDQNAQRASETPKVTPFNRSKIQPMRDTDTHKLLLGIMPVITLWNPNNVPMVMDNSQILRFTTPPFALRWRKFRDGAGVYDYRYFNLNYAMGGSSSTSGIADWGRVYIVTYRFARSAPIVFEPGEVKMFSAPASAGGTLSEVDEVAQFRNELIDPVNSWDPNGIYLVPRSTPQGGYGNEAPEAYNFNLPGLPDYRGTYNNRENLVFSENDRISVEIVSEHSTSGQDGRRVSFRSEVLGAPFNLSMTDEGFYYGRNRVDFTRNFQLLSRHGAEWVHGATLLPIDTEQVNFSKKLMEPAFPNGDGLIAFKDIINAIKCEDIIDATAAGEAIGLMDFSLSYGCEVGANSVGGFSSGRRIASRPFLHSALNAAPFFDKTDKKHLYNFGWDWQLSLINNVEDSVVQGDGPTGRGYFGGGYTIEAGTTHVVHREIPTVPPISIASLSHVHLGGFSLAENNTVGNNPDTDNYAVSIWQRDANNRVRVPVGTDYQQITATGQGGLAPHVTQAIGNSYAHPNIAADEAYDLEWERYFDAHEVPVDVPFVDHSYLANKALWDEYFFSSITPQLGSVELYDATTRTAREVATDFFDDGTTLPNRRFSAYAVGITDDRMDELFDNYDIYTDGFADKIASHLMVDGSFNINSTSKEAWKILFSSLKGKPNVYLASGDTPSETTLNGTVVSFGSLPSYEPIEASTTATPTLDGPNTPAEQWKSGRELTDDDIDLLATAMVKQVKRRGPFLSLSEFINRRLDRTVEDFALKGALQAALDDTSVPINASFRELGRLLDAETPDADFNFAFDAAADGPIAYGSSAYVDQADILRGLAGQLTPRGDTFVIRTYGDSISQDGRILARAWCEAVVQRVPDYVDSADAAHVKQAALTSDANQLFGRRLKVINFRWLNADEI